MSSWRWRPRTSVLQICVLLSLSLWCGSRNCFKFSRVPLGVSGADLYPRDELGAGFPRIVLENDTLSTLEAKILLEFRMGIFDPNNVFSSWSLENPNICNWRGVTCQAGQVSALNLSGCSLSGSISPSLGHLQFLSSLDLSNNNLTGNIPAELGLLQNLDRLNLSANRIRGSIPLTISNCTSLRLLSLSFNNLSSSIPPQLGLLQNLQELFLDNNILSGSIPGSLVNCSGLRSLVLSFNRLSGDLSLEWSRFSQLQNLYLEGNQLTGKIPESLGSCPSLFVIYLPSNRLSGKLPTSLGNLQNLQIFSASGNLLTENIPSSLGNLSSLTALYLSQNRLTGRIPHELGKLSRLQALHLWDNNLEGVIPATLTNCTSLVRLALSGNKLTGIIPGEIGKLTFLASLFLQANMLQGPIPPEISNLALVQIIDFSLNNLSGAIPSSLGTCKNLQSLILSSNNIEGEIPLSLTTIPGLIVFDVSFNKLSGSVPDKGSFSNFSSGSFAGNPSLCGRMLDQKCSSSSPRKWIDAVSGVAAAFAIVAVGVCVWFFCTRTLKQGRLVPISDLPPMSHFTDEVTLSVDDIVAATDGFSDASIIGLGGRSIVYKGILPTNQVVAVKKLALGSDERAKHELSHVLHRFSSLRHPNLLRVYGLCSTADFTALVVEYMPKGSLHMQLHAPHSTCSLTWSQRLGMAIGVADALAYLHHEFSKPIIHLNLKPSNILLAEDLTVKVADYAISRYVNHERHGEATVSSSLYGTIGYIPPEYGASPDVSTTGDVYNYGVVLLELLTGKQPTDDIFGAQDEAPSLRAWVLAAFPNSISRVVDSAIHDAKDQAIRMMLRLSLSCTADVPRERPTMLQVRDMLDQIKQVG